LIDSKIIETLLQNASMAKELDKENENNWVLFIKKSILSSFWLKKN